MISLLYEFVAWHPRNWQDIRRFGKLDRVLCYYGFTNQMNKKEEWRYTRWSITTSSDYFEHGSLLVYIAGLPSSLEDSLYNSPDISQRDHRY